ncbi:MAG: hypothetical protein JO201_03335 [Verrucomicrobia bacterium]|nr:hypothetical protein [Verrucomicrobiota bacterium]
MGVHSGPVSGTTGVNDRSNVAGAGINIAQRVMDCGDAGHILLSKRVAEDLAQYRHWQQYLHDLRKTDALAEGHRAVELLPVSRDAVNGYQLLTRLIMIYAQAGEFDLALDAMEREAHNPYAPEYGSLTLDRVWDPLRGNTRFARFVASLAPKDSR